MAGCLITRGDTLLDADLPWARADVLGRVVSIELRGERVAVRRYAPAWRKVVGVALGESGRLVRAAMRAREIIWGTERDAGCQMLDVS